MTRDLQTVSSVLKNLISFDELPEITGSVNIRTNKKWIDPKNLFKIKNLSSIGMGLAFLKTHGVLQPYFAHHEGTTSLVTGLTVGGVLGISALVNIRSEDNNWEKKGVIAFTTPTAIVGLVGGVLVAVGTGGGGIGLVIIPGSFVLGEILGGKIGHHVGTKAYQGSQGAKTAIYPTGVLSIPAAIWIYSFYFALGSES